MTRINTIDPCELTDQHLKAEYRELPRVLRAVAAGRIRLQPPAPAYVMGQGHVRWFYPRGGYLVRRYQAIVAEMLERGFTVNYPEPPPATPGLDADWTPTEADRETNLVRLRERLREKPEGWYRYGGFPVGFDFYGE